MEWKKEYDNLIFAGNVKEAIQLCYQNIQPSDKIYKFVSGTKKQFEALKDNSIWLSRAIYFNDPFDCSFFVNKRSKSVYDRQTESLLAMKEYNSQKEQDKISEEIQKKCLVTSFSSISDSILMWSYYAKNHKGYCIEYSLSELSDRTLILPVVYSENMLQIEDYDNDSIIKGMLVKAKCWEHEHEWRIIEIEDNPNTEKGRLLKDIPTPTAIYYGSRIWNKSFDDGDIDINDIFDYTKENRIELYGYDTNREKYELKLFRVIQ